MFTKISLTKRQNSQEMSQFIQIIFHLLLKRCLEGYYFLKCILLRNALK